MLETRSHRLRSAGLQPRLANRRIGHGAHAVSGWGILFVTAESLERTWLDWGFESSPHLLDWATCGPPLWLVLLEVMAVVLLVLQRPFTGLLVTYRAGSMGQALQVCVALRFESIGCISCYFRQAVALSQQKSPC